MRPSGFVFAFILFTHCPVSPVRAADVDVTLSNGGGVYDAATGRLYAVTGGGVTPVNPATGSTETPVVVTPTGTIVPWTTALTETGSQFYVAHDGGKRIARVDLAGRAVMEDFSLGSDARGERTAVALAPLPGESARIAAVVTSGSYWRYEVFQGGVQVASSAETFGVPPLLFAGDAAGELCAITDPGNSACKLVRLTVSGVAVTPVAVDAMPTANFAQKRGRYIVTSGSIWDSTNHLYIGNPPGFGGPFDLDEAGDRMVAALSNGNAGEKVLTVVEPSTGAQIHEQVFPLPGSGQPMPLLACGAGRVAHFHENGIALRDFGAFPQAGQADLAVRQMVGPGTRTVGQPVSVTVLVRNTSKTTAAGAALHWSGMTVGGAAQVLSTSGTVTVTGGEVDVALGDLAPGEQATVTLSFAALAAGAPASVATVTCATPEAMTGNNTHSLAMTPADLPIVTLDLPNGVQTDHDPASGHVFTLLGEGPEPGRQASFWAGQIAEIDPATARIVAFHRVPGRATCFTIQSGRIFAGLRNNGGVISRALVGGNWTSPMQVGTETTGRPLVPMDVAVGLATPETLVVARQRQISVGQSSGFASEWEPAAAVKEGVVLASVGPPCSQVESGRDGEVFGVYLSSSFYRLAVGAGGLTQDLQQPVSAPAGARLRYHQRACYYGSAFYDRDGQDYYSFFNAVGIVPDPVGDRIFWFEKRSVAFSPAYLRAAVRSTRVNTGGKTWSHLPDHNTSFAPFHQGDLLRWGDHGLLGASGGLLEFSEHADLIPPPPVRVLLPATVTENAGTLTGAGLVQLSRPTPSALTVNLISSDPTRLQVPASVIIPAGGVSATFDLTPVADPALTGPKAVTITPAAAGWTPWAGSTFLADAQSVVVSLAIPATLSEEAGFLPTGGAVSISQALPFALDVTVSSNHATALGIVFSNRNEAVVTIPAGQTSVTFALGVNGNSVIDGDKNLVVTASVPGWTPAVSNLLIEDDESPVLSFTPSSASFREGAGGASVEVMTDGALLVPLTVSIQSSDTTEVVADATTVTIPAGSSSAIVPFSIVDDDAKDGAQICLLTASAPGFASGVMSVTVRDNEPASFAWPAIAGPVAAGSEINTALRAITVDGDELPFSGAIQITSSVNGQPGAVFPGVLDGLAATGSTRFWLTKAGTTVLTATAGDVTGTSASFNVQPAAAGRFVWSAITSPVLPGMPEPFSISATDAFGNLVTGFNGAAALNAYAQTRTDTVGAGSGGWSDVLNPAASRARCQVLIHSTAMAGAGRIQNLALELLGAPMRPYEDVTIRIKPTALTSSPNAWESSGWTVVREGPWMPSGTGWNTLPFQIPFDYDGTSNLLVDISFANASPAGQVLCMATSGSGAYARFGSTSDAGQGLPVTWSGAAPSGANVERPNLRLGFGTAITVAPALTTAFANGVWTGDLTLTGAVPVNAILQAASGGISGESDVFELGRFPTAAPVFNTEPGFTQGTSNTVSWAAVPLAGSYYVERAASGDFSAPIASGWITDTSHTFTGLAEGETWYYRVKARRADDTSVESDWSAVVVSTQDSTGPEIWVGGLPPGPGGTLSSIRASITLSGSAWELNGSQVETVTVNGQTPALGPVSGGPGLIIYGSVSWSITIAMPASGSASLPIIATDSAGNSSTRTVTLVRLVDANADNLPDDWQQSTGLTGGGVPPADAGPDGDPDHDGLTNAMEFARGTHPLVGDARTPVVTRVPSSGFFTPASTVFEYDRRIDARDWLFEVQASTDLVGWTTVSGPISSTPNPDGITEHVSVSISDGGGFIVGGGLLMPGGGIVILPSPPPAQKFLRLRVSPRP